MANRDGSPSCSPLHNPARLGSKGNPKRMPPRAKSEPRYRGTPERVVCGVVVRTLRRKAIDPVVELRIPFKGVCRVNAGSVGMALVIERDLREKTPLHARSWTARVTPLGPCIVLMEG